MSAVTAFHKLWRIISINALISFLSIALLFTNSSMNKTIGESRIAKKIAFYHDKSTSTGNVSVDKIKIYFKTKHVVYVITKSV